MVFNAKKCIATALFIASSSVYAAEFIEPISATADLNFVKSVGPLTANIIPVPDLNDALIGGEKVADISITSPNPVAISYRWMQSVGMHQDDYTVGVNGQNTGSQLFLTFGDKTAVPVTDDNGETYLSNGQNQMSLDQTILTDDFMNVIGPIKADVYTVAIEAAIYQS